MEELDCPDARVEEELVVNKEGTERDRSQQP
jgi:hypothetical protein